MSRLAPTTCTALIFILRMDFWSAAIVIPLQLLNIVIELCCMFFENTIKLGHRTYIYMRTQGIYLLWRYEV